MEVKIENKKLIINIDLQKPILSESGKSLVVASTHGYVPTECTVDGKKIRPGLNAYIKK
jgi:hypothetical protein